MITNFKLFEDESTDESSSKEEWIVSTDWPDLEMFLHMNGCDVYEGYARQIRQSRHQRKYMKISKWYDEKGEPNFQYDHATREDVNRIRKFRPTAENYEEWDEIRRGHKRKVIKYDVDPYGEENWGVFEGKSREDEWEERHMDGVMTFFNSPDMERWEPDPYKRIDKWLETHKKNPNNSIQLTEDEAAKIRKKLAKDNKIKKVNRQISELDPYGEENWEEPGIVGYFYVYRHRNDVSKEYAEKYLKEEKPKIYKSFAEANRALYRACFDDCGEAIFALYSSGEIKRERFR